MNKAEGLQPQNLVVKVASTLSEIEQALRLRYQVFVEEPKNIHLMNETGLEQDEFDAYSDHLIVTDLDTQQVIGTYRLLPGERALQHIGFYSETEFDLSSFKDYMPETLEIGRSCILPEYRNGRAIQMLWSGIADYIKRSGHQYLVGCVSLHLTNIQEINELYSMLKHKGVITDRYSVRPLDTHRIKELKLLDESEFDAKLVNRKLPPLLKGYQWLGAELAGEPVCDPVFQTIDFFVVLETAKVTKRYQRRFLG